MAKLTEGIKTISGIILQYPFYAGIMAIMAASGLVTTISKIFVDVATPETLPFWGLISSFVINFFAPSAGGHWVIQGPFMIDAAKEIGSALNQTTMAVMLGNAWNDLVQPFWILPALALSKLKLRDVMGYTVIMMLWVGVIHIAAVLLWGYAALGPPYALRAPPGASPTTEGGLPRRYACLPSGAPLTDRQSRIW